MSSESESIATMIAELVGIPSRGGLDPPDSVLHYIEEWLREHRLSSRRLLDRATGDLVGLVCDVEGRRQGPRYVLNACVDTAPFGNDHEWAYPPASAKVVDGWLYGRGSADSKAAIAIFSHIAAAFANETGLHGTLTLLFDADEHTGLFRGAKRFFEGECE